MIWAITWSETMEIKELIEFPVNMAKAIARGVGRMIMDIWEDNVNRGNPYIDMSDEQRAETCRKDLE